MKPPAPTALRLVTRAGGKPPAPPFGLSKWSAEAEARAVLLDASETALDSLAAVAAQIPAASVLPPATLVLVLAPAVGQAGLFGRILGSRKVAVARLLRCGALLAHGYVNIGAGVDSPTGLDLAWGIVPTR